MLQRLTILLVLLVGPGCSHTYGVRPETVRPDGGVTGPHLDNNFPTYTTVKVGQNVKLLLHPTSRVCVAETEERACTLEGKLLRLELSADGEVTGFIVEATSLFAEHFRARAGKRPSRTKLAVPAGELRLPIVEIMAVYGKYWYVPGT